MKTLTLLIVISLTTISCHENRFTTSDLPSRDLIDSVVSSAIEASDFVVTKYSNQQLDTLKDKDSWKPFYNLNSEIEEWEIDTSINHKLNEELKESIKHFSFEYLNKRLYQQDSLILFNAHDSSFMIYQIKNKFRDTLNLKTIRNVSYVNRKEIAIQPDLLKHNYAGWYPYCQITKPLFNKAKTISVVGLSILDRNSRKSDHEGGVLMILKRKEDRWVFVTDIDWWGH
jgi:hypothetical protein